MPKTRRSWPWLVAAVFAVAPARLLAQDTTAVSAAASDSVAQRDLMDVLSRIFKGKPKVEQTVTERPNFVLSILPSFSANPAIGLQLGIATNALWRLGDSATTSLSTAYASVSYTTKKQFNVVLRSAISTSGNTWRFDGDWRYLDTNQPTYGVGSSKPQSNESPMKFKLLRFHETGYREVTNGLQLGLGYHLDHYYDIIDEDAVAGQLTPFLDYNGGETVTLTTSSGVSLNLQHESRDNPFNASRGFYVRARLRDNPTWLGSSEHWNEMQGEFRSYVSLDPRNRNILAFWVNAWFTGGHAPYLDLPAIGWDLAGRSGRGFAQGRIRAPDLFYTEAEYRRVLTRNGLLGMVVFTNLTGASELDGTLNEPDIAGGLGIRIKLNKHSNTNIAIDFATGNRSAFGVYFGTGEAF